jgi:hypothetical protein
MVLARRFRILLKAIRFWGAGRKACSLGAQEHRCACSGQQTGEDRGGRAAAQGEIYRWRVAATDALSLQKADKIMTTGLRRFPSRLKALPESQIR